jgi:hypothetical protein
MSLIPDKNLFIVVSSLKPNMGAFSDDDRFAQTIASLKSLRKHVPDAFIVFSDISVRPVSDLEKQTIAGLSNAYIDMSQQPDVKKCSENKLKSQAENLLLFFTLHTLKQNNMLNGVKRIFKFSARSELEDTFDIKEYDNLFGKYVFKKAIPTWMTNGPRNLFITRMFSFCPSLVDNYLGVIQKNLPMLNQIDTEHAHWVNIPKEYLVEFDKVHCWGWLAGNGQIEHY